MKTGVHPNPRDRATRPGPARRAARRPAWLASAALSLAPVHAGADVPDACQALNGLTPICGFQRPEDIEVMPGERTLLVSEYGSLDGLRRGRLTLYRIADGASETLYPGPVDLPGNRRWGEMDCPGPPGEGLSPHGIHHSETGGRNRLLVVNHGGREAVELFELEPANDGAVSLTWRGCVIAPDGVWLNDVVGLPGGGIAATHMMPRGSDETAIHAAETSREDTGYVLEWQPGSGWRRLAGTDGGLPNGIEISADGATLYINYYFGDRVAAVDRASGRRLWETALDAPDNSSLTAAGKLLVASHRENLDAVFACNEPGVAICPLAFAVVEIDPADGRARTLFEAAGPPMAGATVAVQAGPVIFLGSFAGDRMARFERRPDPRVTPDRAAAHATPPLFAFRSRTRR